jgi:hypothetical protein
VIAAATASTFELIGAAGFGAVIGWYLYFINRYRSDAVKVADLVTVIAALGGGAILRLFPARSQLFGAYGVGLFAGFFAYFFFLVVFVARSDAGFTFDWFLDGRSPALKPGQERLGTQRPMEHEGDVLAG